MTVEREVSLRLENLLSAKQRGDLRDSWNEKEGRVERKDKTNNDETRF